MNSIFKLKRSYISLICSHRNCYFYKRYKHTVMAGPVDKNKERTFIMVKPDGVQRGLVGEIIKRFEKRGFKLVALKMEQASVEHLEEHYTDLREKGFFKGLITYMNSGPVVPMVWEGLDAVKTGRSILGATNPLASNPGKIRGDFCLATGRNICHGSDAVDSALREIKHWFGTTELPDYEMNQSKWVFE